MAKEKDKDDKDAGKGKGKSKKKLLIIIIAAVVVAAGGGVGGYFMFKPSEEKEAEPVPGMIVSLDPITINLTDSHYLKLGIAIQATAEVLEEPSGAKALDIAIDLFSNRSVAELSSNEERNRMKKTFKDKLWKAYDKEIMDVYYTQFVMQ